ncbi:hypothetical protein [Novosphingobium percolationis]|uniref:hypothetical protein n=1 Tax=Novosphingobium percolationis TaxID=2871811 RepID=UPI001CD55629|nr:hypothetical protein [Novosphingobium percolationis]
MADLPRGFVAQQALTSAGINAGFSLAFFLLVFGLPGRVLTLGAPDGLALDFVPQSGAVALMSALVPVLVTRAEVARLRGSTPRPVRSIVLAALAWALAGLVFGGMVAFVIGALGPAVLAGWPAFAMKLTYGGALGATVTALALRRG